MNFMDIESLQGLIDPALIIIVPMLWGIGLAAKKSTIENRFIPAILLVCSCLVSMLHLAGNMLSADGADKAACIFAGLTQGSVIWLLAWLGYEKFLHGKDGKNG